MFQKKEGERQRETETEICRVWQQRRKTEALEWLLQKEVRREGRRRSVSSLGAGTAFSGKLKRKFPRNCWLNPEGWGEPRVPQGSMELKPEYIQNKVL